MTVDWLDSLLCLQHVYMNAVTWQPIYNDNYTKSSVALQSLSKCWCIIVFWHCIRIMLWFNWYLGLWKNVLLCFSGPVEFFGPFWTSNVTSVTEVRSACLFAGTWRPLVSAVTTLSCCDFVIIVRFLCSVCVFEVRASSSSPRLP